MWPWVRDGALVHATPAQLGELRAGQLVVVERGGTLAIHRALRIEADRLVCAGDALATADPACAADQVLARARVVYQAVPRWRIPRPDHARLLARGLVRRAGVSISVRFPARLLRSGTRLVTWFRRSLRSLL
jgi:hypothetical protein